MPVHTSKNAWWPPLATTALILSMVGVHLYIEPRFFYWDDVQHTFAPVFYAIGERLREGDWPATTLLLWQGGFLVGEGLYQLFNPISLGIFAILPRNRRHSAGHGASRHRLADHRWLGGSCACGKTRGNFTSGPCWQACHTALSPLLPLLASRKLGQRRHRLCRLSLGPFLSRLAATLALERLGSCVRDLHRWCIGLDPRHHPTHGLWFGRGVLLPRPGHRDQGSPGIRPVALVRCASRLAPTSYDDRCSPGQHASIEL